LDCTTHKNLQFQLRRLFSHQLSGTSLTQNSFATVNLPIREARQVKAYQNISELGL